LTGDRTDNIPGIKGIGDKKADKILDGLEEEEDLYRAVLEVYKYNRDYLLEQGRLLWIRRKKEELWMLPE
jgi:5'-3' exonuclease